MDKKTLIAVHMIIGKRDEPFLFASLESLINCVDIVVINDNSNGTSLFNINAVKNTTLYKNDKIKIINSDFSGFANARNICLEYIGKLSVEYDTTWIIKIDSDEVQHGAFYNITRDILPYLPGCIGIVDTYYFQFIQSFEYFARIERRHDFIFRFNKNLEWEGAVHEKLNGTHGQRIALNYVFLHYGYAVPTEGILEKWKLYEKLGDSSYNYLDNVDHRYMMDTEGFASYHFNSRHPNVVLPVIDEIKHKHPESYIRFANLIKKHQKKTLNEKLSHYYNYLNIKQCLFFRKFQAYLRFFNNNEIKNGLIKFNRENKKYLL